jgi:hypothetical protein
MAQVVEFLRRQETGVDAVYIARHLNMLLGDVYGELVTAEAEGTAEVVVTHNRGLRPLTQWRAAPRIENGKT